MNVDWLVRGVEGSTVRVRAVRDSGGAHVELFFSRAFARSEGGVKRLSIVRAESEVSEMIEKYIGSGLGRSLEELRTRAMFYVWYLQFHVCVYTIRHDHAVTTQTTPFR